MRAEFLAGVPAVDGGVILHARIAALPGGLGDLVHQVARLVALYRLALAHRTGHKVTILHHGLHELVVDPDRVVGVLEEDGAVGIGIRSAGVIALCRQGKGLGLFLLLALDKVHDVGMVDIEDHHLGGAARLAARLDNARKGVKALHKAQRSAEACPPPERISIEPRSGDRLVPVPEPHLKSMPSVLARVRIESSVSCTLLMKHAEHCG